MSNRAQRRAERGSLKSRTYCTRCSIHWYERFTIWSTCTVNAPPALIAPGHIWVVNG